MAGGCAAAIEIAGSILALSNSGGGGAAVWPADQFIVHFL